MTIVYNRLSMVFKLQFFLLNSDNAVGSTATLDLINTVQHYVSLIFNGLPFLKTTKSSFLFLLNEMILFYFLSNYHANRKL